MFDANLRTAFSRFEIVVAVVMLGVLAIVAVPHYARAESKSRVATCAEQMHRIARAFELFNASNGYWPPDTGVGQFPPEMRSLFKGDNLFAGETPIGGQFDYEHKENDPVLCIYIRGSETIAPPSLGDAMALDAELDDGDLRSGNFRKIGEDFAYAFNRK